MENWFNISVVYILAWWLVFFMALPFGIQTPENPEEGHSSGAPRHPYLGRKALAATILAAFLTWGFFELIHSGLITVREDIN